MIKLLLLFVLLIPVDHQVDDTGEYPMYSQRDSRWSGIGLGDTQYSMYWNGCFIAAVAMMVSDRYEERITPADVHTALYEGGAMYGHITDLTMVDDVYDGVQLVSIVGQGAWFNASMIDGPLDQGHYVFVGVDAIPSTARIEPHWMLITEGRDGKYIVYNPWAWPGYQRQSFPGYYSNGSVWTTIRTIAVFRRQ